MAMEKKKIRCIRKLAFSKKYELDTVLSGCIDRKNYDEFKFFGSPVIQTIFRYQIDYLLHFSKFWFKNRQIKILDWGCGRGHVSYWLKEKGADVVSCDIGDEITMKSPIANLADIDFIELKHEYSLPFEDSSFDVVMSFGVLEHVPNESESLKEINRILKRDGLFFCFYLPYKLSYTQHISRFFGRPCHDRLYWKRTVKKIMEKSNFEIVDIWHRAIFPKRSCVFPFYRFLERIDNWLCNYSVVKYFATNIEFVAKKTE
jgi:SAM-dependent methyltransferase